MRELVGTACRAFLLTALAMGATVIGYAVAIWL
jgi:hypothetical protein